MADTCMVSAPFGQFGGRIVCKEPLPCRFHPGTQVNIIINGKPVRTREQRVSFDQVRIAAEMPKADTVTYAKAIAIHGYERTAGTLIKGQSVRIQEGTIFNVTDTSRA